jgi:hypothetical protein
MILERNKMKKKNNNSERDYSRLSWDELTPEEQQRFKVRYTVLKITEIVTVLVIVYGVYYFFK